ncbi:Kelch repeat-containing protein [Flagellimonas pacifica]|uniref:WD40-like Beta Propeller Repeat n=1 Tax=Flagellimonas pacifica TaxID=1247520 RepID=A0A285MWE7_9FLAO|nr:kelch repeat-containing protein [Allomuricauda parva]SNY99801.1 WD40-like Beta Propeller Repeat [Allomuricauda parva]
MINGRIIAFFFFSIWVNAQEEISVSPAMEVLKDFDKIRDFTLSESGDEAYFTIQSQTEEISVIAQSRKGKNGWEAPTLAPFSGTYKDLEPFLAPNGLRLYYVSNRPMNETKMETKDFDIWYVERNDRTSDWSQPINLGAPVNSENNEFYPALAENGNLYFTCDCPTAIGRDDIFFSKFENGKYSEPIPLSSNVNSEGFEYNAYISKDESYLLFGGYNREDGHGSGDIYISYKNSSGEWSKAQPLPLNINSKYMDYCPFVDETNNIIYFTSRRSTNPNVPIESIESLSKFLDIYENGNSRLYKAEINIKMFIE